METRQSIESGDIAQIATMKSGFYVIGMGVTGMPTARNWNCFWQSNNVNLSVLLAFSSGISTDTHAFYKHCNEGSWDEWKELATTAASFIPQTDNTINIGSGQNRIKDGFFANPITVSSDERLKTAIQPIDVEKFRPFFMAVEPLSYEFTDTGKEPYERRTHCGFGAQQVLRAMAENGIGTQDFAGFVCEPMCEYYETGEYESIESVDEFGASHTEKIPKVGRRVVDTQFGLRHDEFNGILWAIVQDQQRRIENMETLIASLEKAQ